MSRPEITSALAQLLEKYIDPHNDPRVYWAKEVTFDYGTNHAVRVDYMHYVPVNNSVSGIEHGDVYCYEIKSSVEDYASPHGHNHIGDYNYYVMPSAVYEAVRESLPYWVGVMVPCGDYLVCARKAKRRDRSRPISEVLLMMWRSSRREVVNIRRRGGGKSA